MHEPVPQQLEKSNTPITIILGTLPIHSEVLKSALRKIDFLIGSAPVGPTTIQRLQSHAGRLPLVRFGSTETCLQVLGTPRHHSQEERLAIFRGGWTHTYNGEHQPGYYIGQAHSPYTEVMVVKGVDKNKVHLFMKQCSEGEPGLLVTRGGNVMTGYTKNPEATNKALTEDGWYLNLGDVGFWLPNPVDGGKDFFWQSRDSALLIRGPHITQNKK